MRRTKRPTHRERHQHYSQPSELKITDMRMAVVCQQL